MSTSNSLRLLTIHAVIATIISCSPKVSVNVEGPGIQNKQALEDPPSNTSIKNYEEVFLTFQGLTGLVVEDNSSDPTTQFVSPDLTGTCVNTAPNNNPHTLATSNTITLAQAKSIVFCMYNREQSSLASTKNLSSFVGSNQSSIQKLATAFCDAAFRTPVLRSALVGADIIPNQPTMPLVTTLFANDSQKDAFVSRLINRFWTPAQTNPDLGATKAQIVQLLNNMLTQVKPNQELSSIAVAVGVCTPLLASAPVTLR